MDKSTPEATEQVAAPQNADSQITDSGNSADHVETPNERGEVQTGAEATQEATSSSTSDKTDDNASQFDADLDKWAEKRGYGTLETEKERRIAQDARNNQRDFHKERGGEKLTGQVEEAFAPDDELGEDDRYAAIEQRLAVAEARDKTRDFFDGTPDAKEYEAKMAEILKDEQDRYGTEAARWLSRDLNRLYVLAKANGAPSATTEDVENARQEERESLARKTAAAPPSASASTPTTPQKSDGAADILGLSVAEYNAKKSSGWNPIRDS